MSSIKNWIIGILLLMLIAAGGISKYEIKKNATLNQQLGSAQQANTECAKKNADLLRIAHDNDVKIQGLEDENQTLKNNLSVSAGKISDLQEKAKNTQARIKYVTIPTTCEGKMQFLLDEALKMKEEHQ